MLNSLKVTKKSTLKMYNNKRYNLVINHARPKILSRTRDIYLRRPLKIALDQISEYQIDENVNQKKNQMFSLTQMCKI